MRKFILLLFFLFYTTLSSAQQYVNYYKEQIKKYPDTIKLVNGLAYEFINSQVDSTLFYIEKAIKMGYQQGDSVSLANSFYIKGHALDNKGLPEVSKASFLKSMKFSAKMKMYDRYTYTLNSLGILLVKSGKKDSALYYYEKCLSEVRKFDSKGADASILYNLGNLNESLGNYAEALSKFLESLHLREQNKDPYRSSLCYYAIGNLFKKQKKYLQSISYYQEAAALLDTSSNTMQLINTYNSLFDLYIINNNIDSANYYLTLSENLSQSIKNNNVIQYNQLLKGILCLKSGQFEKALGIAQNSVKYYTKIKYPELEMEAYLLQVEANYQMGNTTLAESIARKSLEKFKHLNSKELTMKFHFLLTLINESLKNYKKALHHERLFHTYDDSVYNVRLAGELADLRVSYEKEKSTRQLERFSSEEKLKQQELDQLQMRLIGLFIGILLLGITIFIILRLLHSRNKLVNELEEKNDIIEQALIEREWLLKEIHHRVKNNLQIVSSLLSIHSEVEYSVQEVIKASQERIQAMAMIHEKLYQSENFNSLDVGNYVDNLVGQYQSTYQSLDYCPTFKTQLSKLILSLDKLVPLGLIINECITNAIKYAFQGQGENVINIKLEKHESKVFLSISDNGTGLKTDRSKKSSLGMRLIEGLVQQLDGSLEIIVRNGTLYQILFPI